MHCGDKVEKTKGMLKKAYKKSQKAQVKVIKPGNQPKPQLAKLMGKMTISKKPTVKKTTIAKKAKPVPKPVKKNNNNNNNGYKSNNSIRSTGSFEFNNMRF